MDHPLQQELTRWYRTARTVWETHTKVREIAVSMGMSEREYCDRYLHALWFPMTWTSSSTALPLLDCDRAFREAAS